MGYTLKNLAKRECSNKCIFSNRLVVELAEQFHFHYRNLRITLSLSDFIELSRGLVATLDRWGKLGQPEPKKGIHIELCRRKVATEAHNDGIQVNLNKNLYNDNKGKIFAEGADFEDKHYIHLKIRDLRIEMSIKEFEEYADVITEAKRKLEDSHTLPGVSQT